MKESFKPNLRGKTEVLQLLSSYQNALEGEKRYHDILDNLLEGFQIISPDWRYLYVNNAVVRQSKYTRKELLDHSMMELYPDIEKTSMFKILQLCMNAKVCKQFENEFKYPDNSIGWFELSVQPVQEGIAILSVDITARKKSELKNKHYSEGVEKMLYTTSHKIRQPIAHILGLTNIIKDFSGSPEDLSRIIHYLKESADSLDTLTKDLTHSLESLRKRARDGA